MHEHHKSLISSEGGGSFPSSCLGVEMIIPFPVLMDVSKCFPNACMAAAVPSCHFSHPSGIGKVRSRAGRILCAGFCAQLSTERRGGNRETALPKVTEGENSPGILFPGPITFPCAYFYHSSSFSPLSNAGTCCFDPIHREYSGSQTPGLAKHP